MSFQGCVKCEACGARAFATANNALSLAFALEQANSEHQRACEQPRRARIDTLRMQAETLTTVPGDTRLGTFGAQP